MTTYYAYSAFLTPGTVAKADDVNARFQSVETAFTAVAADMDTTVRMSLTAQSPNLTPITSNVAARAGAFLQFTAGGDMRVSNQLLNDFDANGKKITGLPNPTTNTEPVTLVYLINYAGSLAGVPSVAGNAGKVLYTDGVTLAWNNSVLLPLQTGNNGKYLTTDGANPSWVNISQVSALGADRGCEFLHDGTNYGWALNSANRLANPSGALGFIASGAYGFWSSSASVGTLTITSDTSTANSAQKYGYQLRNASTAATTGQLSSENIAADVGDTWTASGAIFTALITAGTIEMAVEFLSGALAVLQTNTVAMTASTDKRYSVSGTAPASTAYVRFIVKWTAATAGEVRIRRCKLEKNAYATPFTLDGAVQYLLAPRATNLFGDRGGTIDFIVNSTAGTQSYDSRLRFTGGTSGTNGKGVLQVSNTRTYFDGVMGWASELAGGNTGAAAAIDLGAAQNQKWTVNSNTTLTVTAPVQVQNNRLKLVDSGGPRTIAWAGSAITWAGGTAPAFSAAGKTLFVSLYYDGTALWGTWVEF